MAEIDHVTNYALKMADVINRGKDGEEMKYVWKIYTQSFPQAENNCHKHSKSEILSSNFSPFETILPLLFQVTDNGDLFSSSKRYFAFV